MENKKPKTVRHKFVVAWGKYVEQTSKRILELVELAEKENAPTTALSRRADGTWRTLEQIEDPGLVATLKEVARFVR